MENFKKTKKFLFDAYDSVSPDDTRLLIDFFESQVDEKDHYTKCHSDRVADYSVLIGKKLGLSDNDLTKLRLGGLFHDLGKIGIPDNILKKDSKLTDDEYERIQSHTSIGADILQKSSVFQEILPIVEFHHEKYDGNGYPFKLKGDNIPLLARITSIADTFDAMTSKRTYRDPLPLDTVKKEFEKFSGTQFDPEISKVFLDILDNQYDEIKQIQNKYH